MVPALPPPPDPPLLNGPRPEPPAATERSRRAVGWLAGAAAAGATAVVTVIATTAGLGLSAAPWAELGRIGLRLSSATLPAIGIQRGGPLLLDSVPAGAHVQLAGREIGLTPLTWDSVPAGRHELLLWAPDYQAWTGELQVLPGLPVTERIFLQPLPARLALSASVAGVHLWVDEEPQGDLPVERSIAPGERSVRLEAAGYESWEGVVRFGPNETRSLHVAASGPRLSVVHGDPSRGVAVVVDNADRARPQSGLSRADVVYEALVEGGITRFLAVYLADEAPVVGPVRSARHYFVRWATEYGAPLIHVSASPQGYAALAATRLPDLDARATWRSRDRPAPHNAYTSIAQAQEALGRRPVGSFGGLRFKVDPSAHEGQPARQAVIPYHASSYTVGWTYDPDWNEYVRTVDRSPHVDRETAEPLRAANVLVLWMNSWLIGDDPYGRLDFVQTGRGRLLALFDGIRIEGSWTRGSLSGVTEYWDEAGNPLALNPGPTWIQIVPPNVQVEIS